MKTELLARLKVHHDRSEELMSEGNTKQDSTEIAFKELQEGMHKDKIKRIMIEGV